MNSVFNKKYKKRIESENNNKEEKIRLLVVFLEIKILLIEEKKEG
jgi:hypothetical protein